MIIVMQWRHPQTVFPTFDADSFTKPLPLLKHVQNVAADGDKSDVDADVDEDDEHLDPSGRYLMMNYSVMMTWCLGKKN